MGHLGWAIVFIYGDMGDKMDKKRVRGMEQGIKHAAYELKLAAERAVKSLETFSVVFKDILEGEDMKHQIKEHENYRADFSGHEATYNEFEDGDLNIKVLRFKKPNQYHMSFTFLFINDKVLHVSGDYGTFSFLFPETRGFVGVALSYDNYIAGKCDSSRDGREPKEFVEEKVIDFLQELIEESEHIDEERKNEISEELIYTEIQNEADYYRFMGDNTDVFSEDYFEYSNEGLVMTHEYVIMKAGLLAACEKMGWLDEIDN